MDPYEEYLRQLAAGGSTGSASKAASSIAPAMEATPFPPVQAAGLGVDVLGQALGAYGQFSQAEEAKRMAEKTQQHDWDRQAALDDAAAEETQRRASLEVGSYAGNTLEELLKNYGKYNSQIGR